MSLSNDELQSCIECFQNALWMEENGFDDWNNLTNGVEECSGTRKCLEAGWNLDMDSEIKELRSKYSKLQQKYEALEEEFENLTLQIVADKECLKIKYESKINEMEVKHKSKIEDLKHEMQKESQIHKQKEHELRLEIETMRSERGDDEDVDLKRRLVDVTGQLRNATNQNRELQLEVNNLRGQLKAQKMYTARVTSNEIQFNQDIEKKTQKQILCNSLPQTGSNVCEYGVVSFESDLDDSELVKMFPELSKKKEIFPTDNKGFDKHKKTAKIQMNRNCTFKLVGAQTEAPSNDFSLENFPELTKYKKPETDSGYGVVSFESVMDTCEILKMFPELSRNKVDLPKGPKSSIPQIDKYGQFKRFGTQIEPQNKNFASEDFSEELWTTRKINRNRTQFVVGKKQFPEFSKSKENNPNSVVENCNNKSEPTKNSIPQLDKNKENIPTGSRFQFENLVWQTSQLPPSPLISLSSNFAENSLNNKYPKKDTHKIQNLKYEPLEISRNSMPVIPDPKATQTFHRINAPTIFKGSRSFRKSPTLPPLLPCSKAGGGYVKKRKRMLYDPE